MDPLPERQFYLYIFQNSTDSFIFARLQRISLRSENDKPMQILPRDEKWAEQRKLSSSLEV